MHSTQESVRRLFDVLGRMPIKCLTSGISARCSVSTEQNFLSLEKESDDRIQAKGLASDLFCKEIEAQLSVEK